jgi:hypothetical protein
MKGHRRAMRHATDRGILLTANIWAWPRMRELQPTVSREVVGRQRAHQITSRPSVPFWSVSEHLVRHFAPHSKQTKNAEPFLARRRFQDLRWGHRPSSEPALDSVLGTETSEGLTGMDWGERGEEGLRFTSAAAPQGHVPENRDWAWGPGGGTPPSAGSSHCGGRRELSESPGDSTTPNTRGVLGDEAWSHSKGLPLTLGGASQGEGAAAVGTGFGMRSARNRSAIIVVIVVTIEKK